MFVYIQLQLSDCLIWIIVKRNINEDWASFYPIDIFLVKIAITVMLITWKFWTQYSWLMYRSRAILQIIFSPQKVDLYTSKYITFDKTNQKEKQKAYVYKGVHEKGWHKINFKKTDNKSMC